MPGWLRAQVLENRHWTDALFSLRVEAAPLRFEAGQFVKLALEIDGERVARPFSFVNPPGDPVLEFYGVLVAEGLLSPRLARLAAGQTLEISDRPSGFLVLSEVPDADTLWLIATGTGLAPFLSILRTEAPWRRYAHVILVHAVRTARELTYRGVIEGVMAARGERFRYVTLVTREAAGEGPLVAGVRAPVLAGRVPAAIRDGRLEAAAGRAFAPEGTQVLLCGNPAMVHDVTETLKERGMRKHRRRTPGQITVENYW
jgi:ferredoxin--NADP+ reductase